MVDKLRKIISFCIIVIEILFITQVSLAESMEFQVNTSIGIKTVIVPDNMTLEEAYIEMAKLYIEERADHEKLIEDTQAIIEKANSFEVVSDELQTLKNDLIEKDNNIIDLYKKLNQKRFFTPVVMFGVGTDSFKQIDHLSFGLGCEFFESTSLIFEVTHPWSINLKVGVKF